MGSGQLNMYCIVLYCIVLYKEAQTSCNTYSKALNLAGISTLQDRRSAACHEFIAQLNPDNPVYKLVASRLASPSASAHYSLRSRDRVKPRQLP